jgi:hypothetical protein
MASTDPSAEKQEPKVEQQQPASNVDMPNGMSLTVEELYDKDKFDLSTMEPGDVFQLLQYVLLGFFLFRSKYIQHTRSIRSLLYILLSVISSRFQDFTTPVHYPFLSNAQCFSCVSIQSKIASPAFIQLQ